MPPILTRDKQDLNDIDRTKEQIKLLKREIVARKERANEIRLKADEEINQYMREISVMQIEIDGMEGQLIEDRQPSLF